MKNEIFFEETQRFRQWWLWAILLFVSGLSLYQLYEKVDFNLPISENMKGSLPLIVGVIINVLLLVLFSTARLETKINNEGVYFRFFPFHIKFQLYPWEDVAAKSVITYSPLMDYGGFGIRGKKAFNVSGNKGLQLVLANGNRRLIGTQKPTELKEILGKV